MPDSSFVEYDSSKQSLQLSGSWTFENYLSIQKSLRNIPADNTIKTIDFSQLERLDLNTASLVAEFVSPSTLEKLVASTQQLNPHHRDIFQQLLRAYQNQQTSSSEAKQPWFAFIAQLGAWVSWQSYQFIILVNFIGRVLLTTLAVLPRPTRWRFTSWFFHMQQAGLAAMPIVALMAFLIGAVVAFLGATVLKDFGAAIYTVDLVAFGFMRELGVLLAAILLAGRTASSFTAQIGAMKVNEELDAMRVEKLDAVELLVIPRILALLIMLPLLSFVSTLAGLLGGAAVAIASLDISPTQYLSILNEVPLRHFWVGLSKAPFFAVVIAIIGCLEGFKVTNSARSIGEHTTSSVVQALFAVILLDAIAALFFMEMQW
ncbi:MAG: ABC transporter permease [Idiomarina sp.]|nr:MAG: ABC transporter permease [Idiomarina sp.]